LTNAPSTPARSNDAWLTFQQQHAMPAEQREAALLLTLQGLCDLTADIQAEVNRPSHALSWRGW